MILEAETKRIDQNNYAYIATREAARSQTISDFIARQRNSSIDEQGKLELYRSVGDFLTLIVFDGDSIVKVDNKFIFRFSWCSERVKIIASI